MKLQVNAVVVGVILLMLIVLTGVCAYLLFFKDPQQDPYSLNQTSASFLVLQARQAVEKSKGEAKVIAEKKYEIIFDIYIKSRSYAVLNKIFF